MEEKIEVTFNIIQRKCFIHQGTDTLEMTDEQAKTLLLALAVRYGLPPELKNAA